jgi:uncharacterized protein (TIGR00369 family)
MISMSIWKNRPTLEKLINMGPNTMVSLLGIEFVEVGDDFLKARMPVDARTHQPYGIMHGGASCTLAETVGSVAAIFCIDPSTQFSVGVEINTSHIKSIKSGWVYGTAKPFHLGKSTQVWEIKIENQEGELISVSRLRIAILDKKS